MKHPSLKIFIPAILFSILLVSFSVGSVTAEEGLVPSWIKNAAGFWADDKIADSEFLSMIKFLIENDVIVIENEDGEYAAKLSLATVLIPNGNFDVSSTSFYLPLNLEIYSGTTVTWVNQDNVPHTIQSQDEFGNVVGLFNSAPLNTGDKFEFKFEEEGVFNYYCSLHPWRVGLVTVK